MLNYNRIVISGRTNVNKRSDLRECGSCHYLTFIWMSAMVVIMY